MDCRSLRYFVAVYEERSLSGASKRCFVAQPSISATMQQLEAELDCALFVRHSKGVTPTREGTKLYTGACRILADVESVKQQVQETADKLPVRLGLMPFLPGKRVSQIIKSLLRGLPQLDLALVDWNEENDARIVSATNVHEDEAFHKLWIDHYVLAIPKEHPLATHEFVELEQLHKLPFISSRPCDISDAWQYTLQLKGIVLDVKATVRTEEYALDLVSAGLGVSVVPRESISSRDELVFREIKGPRLERVVGLAYNRQKPLSKSLLSVLESNPSELLI